jgi:hypothetical protein
MKRKTVQTKYDVPVRRAFRWASEQKFCEAEASRKFQNPSSMAHKGNHICLHRFSFIYVTNALREVAYTCPINAVNCTTKSAIYVLEVICS